MNFIIAKDYEAMGRIAANIVAAQVLTKPDSVLGLATGSTPISLYRELVALYKRGEITFQNVKSFNLDEYVGLLPTDQNSYMYFMKYHLFDHINIKEGNYHCPKGTPKDLHEEAKNYERMIRDAGGIDLQVLGIGPNGHIGFNEPSMKFEKATHITDLDDKTIEANKRFFDKKEDVPKKAITMGIKTIMMAKSIVLLASGSSKAEIVKQAFLGEIMPNIPASVLQLHHNVTVIVDSEAGESIKMHV